MADKDDPLTKAEQDFADAFKTLYEKKRDTKRNAPKVGAMLQYGNMLGLNLAVPLSLLKRRDGGR